MSLAELRAELKSLRKSLNPVPASRMKKADIAMEIARLKGTAPAPKAEEPKTEKPKAVKPKAEKPKVEEKKEDEVKKTKGVRAAPAGAPAEVKVPVVKADKPAKGSEEMKARMAALRAKRAEKKKE